MRLQDIAKHGGDDSVGLKVLSEEQLQNLHQVLLEIMDDILAVCKEHNLKFILIGGSAIGALRSGGIIPWDDDIDVHMEPSDYLKFLDLIKKEKNNSSGKHIKWSKFELNRSSSDLLKKTLDLFSTRRREI